MRKHQRGPSRLGVLRQSATLPPRIVLRGPTWPPRRTANAIGESSDAATECTFYQRPRPPPPPPRPPRSPPRSPPRPPRSRPPPPACSVFGRASFTLRVRPPTCDPFNAVMAFSPSSLLAISTKPKPRDRPVSRSVIMLTRSTCPNGSNICRSSSSDVLKLKFPTKIFFTHRQIGRAHV